MSNPSKGPLPGAGGFKPTGEQKRAIELMPKHNLQIIACAGSGKTEIVSRGISEIIKSGVKPSEIVAFTFTEKAAEEMKARVRLILGQEGNGGAAIGDMYVGTIHSYCFEELKRLRPEYRNFDVLDEASRVAYVSKPAIYYQMLKLNRFELRGNNGLSRYVVISRFIKTADLVLDEGISTKRIRRKDKDLAEAIEAYQAALRHDRYLDFATMINELVALLVSDRKARRELQEHVKHLVVDEYQDINGLQERLIRAMVGPRTKIAVVGDDDQSIYWWRGSVVGYLINFQKQFRGVKTARLEANFRSSEGIVSLANSFIERNIGRKEKKMMAANPFKSEHSPADIQYQHFKSEAEQAKFVTSRMKELLGTDFTDKRGNLYALSYVPRQFIERPAFRVQFAGDDGVMFLPSDGTFVLELNFRPLAFHDDRPRQPRHVQGEVVDASQIYIRRNFSSFEHAQKMFRARFQNWQVPDQIERLVLDGGLPTVLGLACFEFDHLVHDELPVAGGNLRVAGSKIGAGDLQVHGRLLDGLAFGMEQPDGGSPVTGAEAFLFAGYVVMDVVASAVFAAIESVSLSHNCF